jgi:3,4-dihydroxy 2-butanone 4-phosphate synthase / GTP cyclohydrolase II
MRTTDVRVRRAISAIAAGRPVVVTDDTERGGQGYVMLAADAATPGLLAFTVRHTSGYVRVALPGAECDRLNLPPMCHRTGDGLAVGDRVAVDWCGVGTGISATDRANTIAALAAATSEASDFRRPGHVIPVRAGDEGVLGYPAPAEAAVDLAWLAGRRPAATLCEIVSRERPDAMARGAELVEFAKQHRLSLVSIDDLVAYRRRTEPQAVRSAETTIPTDMGASRVIGFRDVHPASSGGEHLVMIIGTASADLPMLLHVHVECITGDVFGSTACRCGAELKRAQTTMRARGSGMIVYLRPSGPVRACGLSEADIPAAKPVSQTVAWILRDLGVHTVRLADDAPGFGLVMFGAIREHGLSVAGEVSALAVAG